MRSKLRTARATVVSLLAVFFLSLSAAFAPAWAGTALVVGGVGQPTVPDWVMKELLNDRFVNDTRHDIYWPAQAKPFTTGTYTLGQSVAIGVDNLLAEISAATEPITVVGMSGGSLVVDDAMRRLLEDPSTAPGVDDITFVIIADSSRQSFINRTKYSSRLDYTYQPAPETQYDVVVVTGEYDGFADFPDRWWNFTAVLNAYAGVLTEHIPTAFADLDAVPLENVTITYNSVGGKTTHYLVPASTLPLVKLFPGLKSREEELKRQIDAAYKRNDPVPAARTAATVAAVQTDDSEDEASAVEPAVASTSSDSADGTDESAAGGGAEEVAPEDDQAGAEPEEALAPAGDDEGAALDDSEAATRDGDDEDGVSADESLATIGDDDESLASADDDADAVGKDDDSDESAESADDESADSNDSNDSDDSADSGTESD